jgi:hypothetical protein
VVKATAAEGLEKVNREPAFSGAWPWCGLYPYLNPGMPIPIPEQILPNLLYRGEGGRDYQAPPVKARHHRDPALKRTMPISLAVSVRVSKQTS